MKKSHGLSIGIQIVSNDIEYLLLNVINLFSMKVTTIRVISIDARIEY